jgi:hypothetical protein
MQLAAEPNLDEAPSLQLRFVTRLQAHKHCIDKWNKAPRISSSYLQICWQVESHTHVLKVLVAEIMELRVCIGI